MISKTLLKTDQTINTSVENRRCKACGLYLNQLPIFDMQKKASVFWVGLSSVMFNAADIKLPLSSSTRSGALISEIEKPFLKRISFYKTNIVKCVPLNISNHKIRYPLKHEMEKCFPNLEDEINGLKPKIIFLLGKQTAEFVYEKFSRKIYSLDEGFQYDSLLINGIRYVPVHHPSYILVYKRRFINDYINGIGSFLDRSVSMIKSKKEEIYNEPITVF